MAGRTSTHATQRAVGARIAELRRERGETQEQLAERVQMSVGHFARLEQGKTNVTLATLVRVASALGVPPLELFQRPRSTVRRRPGRPPKA